MVGGCGNKNREPRYGTWSMEDMVSTTFGVRFTDLRRESVLEMLGMNTEEQEMDHEQGLSKDEQETPVF